MLRKASAAAGFNLVAGAIVGFTLAFYRGRRVGAYSWTEADSRIAPIAVGATLTYTALILPLFAFIRFRRRIADRDHEARLTRSKERGRARFIPDPRSQPRPADLGIPVSICLIAAAPIWTLVL